jgi:LysM repeat protein
MNRRRRIHGFLLAGFLSFGLMSCGKKEETAAPAPSSEAPPPATQQERSADGGSTAGQQDGTAQPAASSDTYRVAKGDTLYGIAKKNGLNYTDVAKWNNIEDPRRLRVGQEAPIEARD